MQLNEDEFSAGDVVRSVGADRVVLGSGERRTSFVIAAGVPAFDWPVDDVQLLRPEHCDVLIALQPAVLLLGTGPTQRFPTRDVLAHFLTRGIGIEVMDNAAAARTYNVLLGERRKVAAAFVIPPV